MDGYAVRSCDIDRASTKHPVSLRLMGEIHAGSPLCFRVEKECAVRVSTGSRIPPGTDAVVMQEDCRVEGNTVFVQALESRWGNIRRKGEEIRKHQIALPKGTVLQPGSLAWLATMGIRQVSVYHRPKVGLLRSGTEVVDWGQSPRAYQIRDAHGVSLPLALQQMGFDVQMPAIVGDNLSLVTRAYGKLLSSCDLLITTGGVSVGDRDLFHAAARAHHVTTIFHKVSQKPGKPMAFGKRGSKIWFGLPGNPVASLVCFYLYIRPALLKMMGHPHPSSTWFEVKTAESYRSNPRRTEFLRGFLEKGRVTFAEKQGSHCLGSFAQTNVLIQLPPSHRIGKVGNRVLCMWLS